ncbi:hypothetical protein [Halobacterium hubeiense]|nr:hypothetical protein [Halobacterium hubeiense]
MYLSWIPVNVIYRVVLYGHLVASAVVSWYYAHKHLNGILPVAIGVQTALVANIFWMHTWKVLAWPWLVLLTWQVAPPHVKNWDRRTGALCGLCVTAMILTGGGIYYAFYGLAILTPFIIQYGSREYLVGLIAGGSVSLLKAPAYLNSLGNPRPPVGYRIDAFNIFLGSSGLANELLRAAFEIDLGTVFDSPYEGFAVVGLPIVFLAAGVFVLWFVNYGPSKHWYTALVGSCSFLVLFATGAAQDFLSVGILRTAARANHAIAMIVIISSVIVAHWVHRRYGHVGKVVIITLVVLSVIQSGLVVGSFLPHQGVTLEEESEVAEVIDSAGGGPVWIQDQPHDPGEHSLVQYALAEHGIHAINPRYPEGLVTFSAFNDGQPRFQFLVSNQKVTNQKISLHPLFMSGSGGEIDRESLTLHKKVTSSDTDWYIYRVSQNDTN